MIHGVGLPFFLASMITLIGALAAATMRNLVHCALSLTVAFGGLALIYLQLDAQFAGFAQILVYIGAVAILVVFAILLTRGVGTTLIHVYAQKWILGLLLAAGVFALLGWAVLTSIPRVAAPEIAVPTVLTIGQSLMHDYVLPLEITAVLLTVALIGAVIVAMPEFKKNGGAE